MFFECDLFSSRPSFLLFSDPRWLPPKYEDTEPALARSKNTRPLKSHDFAVTLTVFSSVSQSHDETQNSHDK